MRATRPAQVFRYQNANDTDLDFLVFTYYQYDVSLQDDEFAKVAPTGDGFESLSCGGLAR